MLKFKEYLLERYFTSHDPVEKEKHLQAAHDMIRSSYQKIGGYSALGHGTERESEAIKKDIRDPNTIMKLHRKNGVPLSVALYKKHHGRKIIAAGTNQSDEGKESLHRIIHDDNKDKRAWGEVSGPMKRVFDKHKMPIVPNTEAERLTGKKIIRKHADGESYDREIGGEIHTKTIGGHPKTQ